VGGPITFGGLASGLDSNSIIDKLIQLDSQPLNTLQTELAAVQATQTSVGTVGGKLSTLGTAVSALSTPDSFLIRNATSSDETVLTAAAGAGAARGSVTINATQLAHGSTATATAGVASATATVATGPGHFSFQVGGGPVQTVSIDGTTTLQGLADAINGLGAGVTASAVNLGTDASPEYRLQIASEATGASSTISIVQDDTSLAVQATQAGQDAHFTVSGFSGTFSRATNSFSDVISGVTISLKSEGTATVTVDNDPDQIVAQVQTFVNAFNDLVTFVDGQSSITESADKNSLQIGSLARDSAVQRVIDRLHSTLSEPFAGAAGRYVNLSSVGIATQMDGTLKLDETKLRAALGDDPNAVAQLFGGTATSSGVATDLSNLIDQATGPGGVMAADTTALTQHAQSLQAQIDDAQRTIDQKKAQLQQQFAALEALVSSLQSQSGVLSVFSSLNSGSTASSAGSPPAAGATSSARTSSSSGA
jgi:flagellar hook-associated protein 2